MIAQSRLRYLIPSHNADTPEIPQTWYSNPTQTANHDPKALTMTTEEDEEECRDASEALYLLLELSCELEPLL